jgi:hypothetical protein
MAAGLAKSPMEMSDLAAMIDAREAKLLCDRRYAMLEALSTGENRWELF